jgi:tRNA G26 N,N-dimethylase Trm1
MQTQNIIVRAFELARGSDNLDDIRKTLRQEGYANVDAHLAGASIKTELKKQFLR